MQFNLIDFLTNELKVPASHIQLALRQIPQTPEQLPMMLWQYGLITLKQLELLWDWQKVYSQTKEEEEFLASSLARQSCPCQLTFQ